MTTSDVAHYCGVTRQGVIKWIKQGKLKAYTTPGGHYRIWKVDFRAFLEEHNLPVDTTLFEEES